MILHTVNKSPFTNQCLASCLRVITPGDVLLLIENGVYGAIAGHACQEQLQALASNCELYALLPDLEARGLAGELMPGMAPTDYAGFVALSARCDKVLSWY